MAEPIFTSLPNFETFPIRKGSLVGMHSSGNGIISAIADSVAHCAIGIAAEDIPSYKYGLVQTTGVFELSNWFTITGAANLVCPADYYLNTVAGNITTTVPGVGDVYQFIGRSVSPKRLELELEPAVIAGGSTTSAEPTSAQFAALSVEVQSNSAQMVSADNAISAVAADALSAARAVSANLTSVLSHQISALSAAIATNSAQMTSADNALSAAIAAVALAEVSLASDVGRISLNLSALSTRADTISATAADALSTARATSANLTSLDSDVGRISLNLSALSTRADAISVLASNAQSIANAVSNRLSTWTLDNLKDVSAPSPADGNVLAWNSAQAQWVASAMAGGGGSVTSANFVSLRSDVGRISNAVSVNTSAIAANSAQMTSADNAISAAVNALSIAHVSLVSDVGRISLNLSALSTRADAISVLASNAQSVANAASVVAADALSAARAVSANLTSVLSNQISALSAAHVSLASDVGRISLNLSALSTRADAISVLASNAQSIANAVSAAQVSLASDVGRISLNLSALSTRADAISVLASNAQSIANAVSNRLSTWTLDNLKDVSAPSPADSNALVWNSAQAQWVASAIAGGTASVTSAEYASAVDRISQVSASLTSVASIASAAASNIVSLASDVGRISTQVAAGLVSAGPVRKVLAGDQLVTATAATSISGFTFTISVSASYSFEFGIAAISPLSTQGIKLYLSSNAILGLAMATQYLNCGSPAALQQTVTNGLNQTAAYVTCSVVNSEYMVWIRGSFRGAGGAGTQNLHILAGTNLSAGAAGSAITLKAGSYGYLWRMG